MATNWPCVCYNVVRVQGECECASHFARLILLRQSHSDGKVKQNHEEIAAEAQSDGEWERKDKACFVSIRFTFRFK